MKDKFNLCVYGLFAGDDENKKVRYVGSGKSLDKRLNGHYKTTKTQDWNSPVENWKRELIADEIEIGMVHFGCGDAEYEKQMIEQFAEWYGEDLLNVLHNPYRDCYWKGKNRSEETKNKISNALTGKLVGEKNPFYNKSHTLETRKLMSELKTGKNHPFYGKTKNRDIVEKQANTIKYNTAKKCGIPEELIEFYIQDATKCERDYIREITRKGTIRNSPKYRQYFNTD